ncbi:hypothetical protein Tco_0716113 [Tanacetum coccineum]
MMPSSSSTDSVNVIQSSVFQNPLFLHPFDCPGSLCVQEKLEKVGYPAWHYKSKQSQQKGKGKATGTSRSAPPKRIAAAVESGSVLFTSKQFEQLMKSLPHFNAQNFNKGGDSNEELDPHFAVEPATSSIPKVITPVSSTNFESTAPVVEIRMFAINDELRALEENGTWEMTTLPPDKKSIEVIGSSRQRVYMKCPPGYAGHGESVKDTKISFLVYKLKKSLYGLKQAPRQYSCHVDDILITSTSSSLMQELKKQLSTTFHMNNLVQYRLTKKTGVLNAKPYKLPMDQHVKLQADIDLRIKDLGPVDLKCDNQVAIHIAANPVFMLGQSILKWIAIM